MNLGGAYQPGTWSRLLYVLPAAVVMFRFVIVHHFMCNPIPVPGAIVFYFYVRSLFIWGHFTRTRSPTPSTGSPNPLPVCIGTEAVFYRARTYYHSSLPSLLLLPHIPIQCGVRTPCQAATQPVWYPYRITQLVFTLRDYGNFIVGLMEFFNTPELFVNYNWIISALFAEFPTNGYTRQTQGVVVLVMWEDDIISAFRHPGG